MSARRFVHALLAVALTFSSIAAYAAGECFDSQQCNYYANTTICYAAGYGTYCGSWGSGCTECVDVNCNSCTVEGNCGCAQGNIQHPIA